MEVNLERFLLFSLVLYLYRKQTYVSLYQNCFAIKSDILRKRKADRMTLTLACSRLSDGGREGTRTSKTLSESLEHTNPCLSTTRPGLKWLAFKFTLCKLCGSLKATFFGEMVKCVIRWCISFLVLEIKY